MANCRCLISDAEKKVNMNKKSFLSLPEIIQRVEVRGEGRKRRREKEETPC